MQYIAYCLKAIATLHADSLVTEGSLITYTDRNTF